ncbi:hypothetical protein K505DRAFT_407521 [Melanomma pulvis-pyrius CBS 109.77]|uniref:Zn(2)-C6 fungal-type domain-containing protein n=1 Tax=Melanomma pulvis-pyrius CBS 109.77 TaxID=1314802 RepID=A0A6A6XEF6_9PLEO|nr:hypothetical protein K505DRAFT_407521 [Melanomma pulvis-pyrius CBS 109.77]
MSGTSLPAKEKRTSRRKHSFGGCRTCRKRHVKCDQIRPTCLACRAVNTACEGYSSDVRWMPPATLASADVIQIGDEDASRKTTRHYLYSEESRALMSTALVAELGSTSVDRSLAEIDAQTKHPQSVGTRGISVGPFGVLNMSATSNEPVSVATQDNPQSSAFNSQLPNVQNEISDQVQPAPGLVDWFDPILGFDNTLHWADLFGLDFDDGNAFLMQNQSSNQSEHILNNLLQAGSSDSLRDNLCPQPQQALDDTLPYAQHEVTIPGIDASQDQHPIILAEVKSVTEAQFLLKHFNDSVIPQMSFMPSNSKSPWTIMQLPEAMRTLSDLSYLHTGKLNHANAANLYGLLACSAYHLSVNLSAETTDSKEYWHNLFDCLKERAKKHMQISLREELKGPKKAKYKDQLMAILSMLAFTVSLSRVTIQRDARCYMIDAERLLRLKGLAKREISRKCRVLHHVYSWIRIVGESTYVLHDYQGYGPMVDNMSALHRADRLYGSREQRAESAKSRLGPNARLDDFLRLEPHSSDSDLDIDEPKDASGLHDIHLEDSRQWRDTMYHIYGISETWLSLVSQTTRLANILDAAKFGKDTDVKFLEFLQKRAGRLENIICSFALKDPTSDEEDEGDSPGPPNSRPLNYHMLRAMNKALVILFYRRIRNVNPLILQGHVDSVVQSLRDFDAAIISQGAQGPGSAWPAFIAGCEAQSRRNRKFLMTWLDKGFDKCGLEYFGASRHLLKEVWERQDDGSKPQARASSYHRTWVDVSREKNTWVILF